MHTQTVMIMIMIIIITFLQEKIVKILLFTWMIMSPLNIANLFD